MTWILSALKVLAIVIAVLLLLWVVALFFAERRAAKLNEAHPPVGEIMTVDGVKTHVLVKGSGPDLLLIHGASGSVMDFTMGVMDELAKSYRVIAIDRPGLGHSARLPYHGGLMGPGAETPTEQAQHIHKVGQALGVENPIFVGQSFGGIIGMAYALEYPDETAAVVSLSGVAMPWSTDLDWTYRLLGNGFGDTFLVPFVAALAPRSMVDASVKSIFAPQDPPENYAETIGAALALRPITLRANMRQVNSVLPRVHELSARYPNLTLPVEFLHGTADTIVPIAIHAEEAVKVLPNANLERLAGVGHMPHHVAVADVLAAVDRAASRAGLR